MYNPYLIGQRCYLRAVQESDVEQLSAMRNHPEIAKGMLQTLPLTVPQLIADVQGRAGPTQIILAVEAIRNENQPLVGELTLHRIDWFNRSAGFGIYISKEHQGKGYGTEASRLLINHAFKTLNLNRLWLRVLKTNDNARLLHKRLGFVEEGVMRKDIFRDGKYIDTIMMGLLQDEWKDE
jgi:RimJ/RimL family protein N-acetyltransferase